MRWFLPSKILTRTRQRIPSDPSGTVSTLLERCPYSQTSLADDAIFYIFSSFHVKHCNNEMLSETTNLVEFDILKI